MKHCQITGVEMPDEINLENHACNTGDCDHYIQNDCDKTLAAYRDAQHASDMSATCQLRDSSAEFPEAEFRTWFTEKYDEVDYTDCAIWGYAVGFERGRASLNGTLNAWEKLNETNERIQRKQQLQIRDIEAKLAEAQAYSKGLEDTILKLTEAFDKAKNGKVICEDCGSALLRS